VEEINLYNLIKYYAKRWYILVIFTVIGILLGLFYNSVIQQPSYKSNSTIFVVNSDLSPVSKESTLINNYLELIKSRRVLEPVIKELNLSENYEDIASSVEVSNEKDTAIIKISVSTNNPETSRNITNATILSFKKQINELYGKENIQVVDSASLPSNPYNVRKNLQIILAGAAGLLFAVIIIFFSYDYKLSTGTLNKKQNKNNATVNKPQKVNGAARGKNGRFQKKNPSLKQRAISTFSRYGNSRGTKKAPKAKKK
jgi:capsular polysaccharide biosynthesis protein